MAVPGKRARRGSTERSQRLPGTSTRKGGSLPFTPRLPQRINGTSVGKPVFARMGGGSHGIRTKPALSCIIITLNEEKYLPALLASLQRQTMEDFEVIVADYNSTDATRVIAGQHGCTVTDGGGFSAGRNKGAAAARADYLLFLDADCLLPPDFLEVNLRRFRESGKGTGTTNVMPLSSRNVDVVIHRLYNLYARCVSWISPHFCGGSIFAVREVFSRVGGFDESIVFAENHDFARRARRYGFAFLPRDVYTSVRRLDREGRLRFILKYVYAELYRLIVREIDRAKFRYENYR